MERNGPRAALIGRRNECRLLDSLLAGVRSGRSEVLVLRGEAGIGKSELLRYLLDRAGDCRVVRASGVQSEMELSYAGLHQLCAPLLDHLDDLPEPQQNALSVAFGMRAGAAPDRFLVGLSALSLLAGRGGDRPLVCVVDDAQWLDSVSAQTLQFVARRLGADALLLVFAVREPAPREILTDLPGLELRGLTEDESRRLLDSVAPGPIDRAVRERIVAESQGNPLALLELPLGLTEVELAGGFTDPDTRPLSRQIESGFVRRIDALSARTRHLLLIAAAEPVGDVALIRQAGERLGIDVDDAFTEAEASGLIRFGTWARFRHPLVRSAAYRTADTDDRRRAHRVLADAIDARIDPDRRAWHLAGAVAGPDEAVAAELERSAARARARGGIAAAAAFLDRSMELTPDPARRSRRALAAARAKFQAGAFEAARELLDAAELGRLDEADAAQALLLRGQIMSASKSASAGLPLLLEAAQRLQPYDAGLARQTYRDAMYAALTAGRLARGGVRDVAEAILRGPRHQAAPTPEDQLLTALSRVITDGYVQGAPALRRAVEAFRTEEITAESGLGWLPLVCRMAHNTWDFETWTVLSARLVELARESGALVVLSSALLLRLSNRVFAGDLHGAGLLVTEAQTIGEATGSRFFAHYGALVVEPFRGREAATREAIDAVAQDRLLRGEGKVLTATQWAMAVLCNGSGRYEEALAAAVRGCANPQELGLSLQSRVELVEAAVRLGRAREAVGAARTVEEMALAAGTPWALGVSAAVRALMSEDAAAEGLHREAVDLLETTQARMDAARARLRYGEWLRAQDRRADARAQLSQAHETLSAAGAEAFAERARRELEAAGARVDGRIVSIVTAPVELTAQEAEIARLAHSGLTNGEIAARLLLSRHTIDWHLRKVFAKMGISSRKQISLERVNGRLLS
ncbi:ATP-binding protein [Streptomyces nigra]|uniref:ATP-binding protein n=1 Tax=Streptomyces nigra TaxID=1827580 RepID=UPI0037D80284